MAKKISIELVGAKELEKALLRAGPDAIKVVAKVLRDESLVMFRESQTQVPHADGILAGSGSVTPPQISGDSVTVKLGYGGAASAYALRQHEDLSLNHPDPANIGKSRASGKAKYLEDPVRDGIERLRSNMAEEVQNLLRGLGK